MLSTLLQKLMTMKGRLEAAQPGPAVRWGEVVRIEALGTDALGPFEVSLTFTHADLTRMTWFVHRKGFHELITSLPHRFPSITPGWYKEMAEQPWHLERILYSRDEDRSVERDRSA